VLPALAICALLSAGPPTVSDLPERLAASDAARRDEAIDKLHSLEEEAWNDRAFTDALGRLLIREKTSAVVKVNVVWAAVMMQRFSVVQTAAKRALREERDPWAVRDLARAISLGIDDQDSVAPSDELMTFFRESSDVTRQEAALAITNHSHALLRPDDYELVIDSLISLMLDERASAIVRGRAIEACQYFATNEPRITSALVQLSQPRHWFPGVQGAHYLSSSIVKVILALSERQCDPAVARRLRELPADLYSSAALTDFDVWLTENSLEWTRRQRP
jgi:hypothetical protein